MSEALTDGKAVGRRPWRGILIFLIAVLVLRPFVIVGAGERVVLFSLTGGVLPYQLDEGFHFMIPIIQRPIRYEVRTQTYAMSKTHWEGEVQGDDSLSTLTSDGQTVSVDISLRFHPHKDAVWKLHQKIGPDYISKIVRPELRSHTRIAIAEFPVTKVFSAERQEIEDRIEERLRKSLGDTFIDVDEVLLQDVRFTEAFQRAVEDKQIAQQNAQRMQYILEKTEKERQQKVIEAEGEAKAINLKAQALSENAKVIQYEYVQKIAPNVRAIITDGRSINVPMGKGQ
ncbi:MAG: prohibitin family protein [Armatimonadetes bacterium]|nr:prohibitin family protein [Armatimonadota bacterium]